jgi:hypothetical protein
MFNIHNDLLVRENVIVKVKLQKKSMVVILKALGAKRKKLAVNRQS